MGVVGRPGEVSDARAEGEANSGTGEAFREVGEAMGEGDIAGDWGWTECGEAMQASLRTAVKVSHSR
jgi:hypothetical protein